jgi:hypothetical protein
MTHAQMERELARATGETVSTLRSRGFQLVEPPDPDLLMVDWEAIDEERLAIFPDRQRRRYAPQKLAA